MGSPPTMDDPLASSPDAARSLTPTPDLIAGRYEIVGLLGVGGMGSVYRARDRELDEIVALKVLRKDMAGTPDMVDRFRREVKLARRVTHRNVARVYDIGEHEGDVFLTMEYVDGQTLSGLIGNGPVDVSRAVEVASAICAGLAAAHAAGVIHRDLKPDNVLVSRDGRILVTDFGIARVVCDPGSPSATAGMVVGTPMYMAPEQLEGAVDIDGRADLYAFGAMLYELLCGTPPWAGPSPIAIASARLYRPPPDPRATRPELPESIARLILRCMARNREDRYASVDRVAAELSSITLPAPRSGPTEVRPAPKASADPEEPTEKSIAVLPFRNAGAPGDDYLADGLTEDLIDSLSMTRGLRVRSRSSVMALKGVDEDPRELGRKLNVQVVVEGSVRKAAARLRISARLISVADGFQLWARRFDRSEADVLAVNDEAARAIAEALTLHLTERRREAPTDPMAIDLYLRARQMFRKLDPPSVAESVLLYEKAIALAPENPTILSGYAVALGRHWFYAGGAGGPRAGELARDAAERAVRAAPNLGEPRLALGWVLLHGGDAPGAVRELKIGLAHAPALAEAHEMLARILSEVGLASEARAGFEKALALDPHLYFSCLEVARDRAFQGKWDDAYAAIERVPPGTDAIVGAFYRVRMSMWQRNPEGARVDLGADAAKGILGVAQGAIVGDSFDPAKLDEIRDLASQGGRRFRTYWAQMRAEMAMFWNRPDVALVELGRSVELGLLDLDWMDRCPLLQPLRESPEFLERRSVVKERADAVIAAYRSS